MTLAALPIVSANFDPFFPFDYLAATFYIGRNIFRPSHVFDCRGGGKHSVSLQGGTLLTVTDQDTTLSGNCTAKIGDTCSVSIQVNISQVVDVEAGTTYYLINANDTPSIAYTECDDDSCTTKSTSIASPTPTFKSNRFMAREPNNNFRIPGLPIGWPFWPSPTTKHTSSSTSSAAAMPTGTPPANSIFAYLNQTLTATAYCSAVDNQSCSFTLTISMEDEFQLQNNATYYLIPNSMSVGYNDAGSDACDGDTCISIGGTGTISGSAQKATAKS